MTADRGGRRLAELDVLRGIAVLLVLGRHIVQVPAGGIGLFLMDVWQNCGWIGVDLFFVLSGFLVSGLLFSEYKLHGSIELSRFFIRRGLKIYPAYYLMGLASVVYFITFGFRVPPMNVISEALFIQNYTDVSLW